MTLSPITRRIHHVQRYAQVLEVLARHGFAELSAELKIDTLIERGRAIIGAAPKPASEPVPLPRRLRHVMEELGPTFVKLGQVLSTRSDLIPEDWVAEFRLLQNSVPGVEYEVIQKALEAQYPQGLKKLFRSIQKKPLAAASMAQVHRARLKNGTRIVLKVLRPGIRETVAIDMEILQSLAEFVEGRFANLGYSPTEAVNEFAKELKREVDLMYEGRSTERLGSLFDGDPEVVFPGVHWEATTHDVLALDEIQGLVLSDYAPGKLSAEDRRKLVENGARAVFMQCLEYGFFHADPHPGNLIAMEGGRIAFIDCGMTGQVDAKTARQLADLVGAVVSADLDRVIAVAGALGDVGQEKLEDRALRSDVNAIISEFRDTPLERLNLGRVLQEFFGTLRKHNVRCPADIILLIKALTTIEGVGRDLDPSFDMVSFVRPYLEKLVSKRWGPTALQGRMKKSALAYLELIEDLPGELRPIFSQLRKNKLAMNIEHHGLDRLTRTIEHASRNISFAVIIAAIVVGSSILVLSARNVGMGALSTFGVAGFLAAAVLAVVMVITNRKRRGG